MKIKLFYYWSIFLLFFNVSIEGSFILNFFSRPKPALELPEEIIKIIVLHCLKDDIKSVSSFHSEDIFDEYSYFLEKGFLKTSQSFNNLLLINKSFSEAALNITYEDKLDLWFEERIIIPDVCFERDLFKQLINKKDPFNENDQKCVISCALKFFAHPDFFDVLYRLSVYKAVVFFDFIMTRGVYRGIAHGMLNNCYRKSLLMDFPHVFFIFYRNVQLNYMHKPVDLKEMFCGKAFSLVRSNTPFLYNDNFDMDWFKKFLALSSDLFNYYFSEESFPLTENLKRHKERLLVNSGKIRKSLKQLFVELINCYSELDIKSGLQLETKWYNKNLLKQLNDDQKIMWFYYTHSIHLAFLCNSQCSFIFVQDLLFEIEKWLKSTYPNTILIVSDELIAQFKGYDWSKVFHLLDYVVQNTKIGDIFNPDLFFSTLRGIFNTKDWIGKKRDNNISKEIFYSNMANQFRDTSMSIIKIQSYIRRLNCYNLLIKEATKAAEQSQEQIVELDCQKPVSNGDVFPRKSKNLNFFDRITVYKKHFFMGAFLLISSIVFYLSRITYFRLIK